LEKANHLLLQSEKRARVLALVFRASAEAP